MESALDLHRLQFAFTVTFHYLFPQLTMGLALLIVVLKTVALRTGDKYYDNSARFWAKIFGINFAVGVVTGIPMEFQFGTNWAEFSKAAGGVIGQTLAMEGLFSFFLESSFLGLFLFGEKKLGRIGHWWAGFFVFLGSWLSGYFIVATDAWMQHPVGYQMTAQWRNRAYEFLGTATEQLGGVAVCAYDVGRCADRMFRNGCRGRLLSALEPRYKLRTHVHPYRGVVGVVAALLQLMPTGDMQGRMVTENQPATLAAMEGLFTSENGAPIAILGQPDVEKRRLDNPLVVPNMLSMLTYRRWNAQVRGLNSFADDLKPDKIELLYYSYHIMVGLGTIFIAIMVVAAFLLWRKKLFESRWMLWVLMLTVPLPYIANTAGWMTAELGRQPWLIYGVMRTVRGASPRVGAGSTLFTLIGFMGMYAVLAILWFFLIYREIELGPDPENKNTLHMPPHVTAD